MLICSTSQKVAAAENVFERYQMAPSVIGNNYFCGQDFMRSSCCQQGSVWATLGHSAPGGAQKVISDRLIITLVLFA